MITSDDDLILLEHQMSGIDHNFSSVKIKEIEGLNLRRRQQDYDIFLSDICFTNENI